MISWWKLRESNDYKASPQNPKGPEARVWGGKRKFGVEAKVWGEAKVSRFWSVDLVDFVLFGIPRVIWCGFGGF